MVIIILPVLKNFSCAQGVGFDYRFQWLQGSPNSALPEDLSTYTATMPLTNYNGGTTYQTLTSSASPGQSGLFFGGDTHTPADGIIDIVLIGSDITALPVSNVRYKLWLTPTSGQPIWLMYGVFTVIA